MELTSVRDEIKSTLFPVSERKLSYENNGSQVRCSGYKAIVNDEDEEVISIVSEDYCLVENKDVILPALEAIEKRGGKLYNIVTGQARFHWRFVFPNYVQEVVPNDIVASGIMISNSYDRSTKISVTLNLMRLVCTNGMIVPSKVFAAIDQRHYNVSKIDYHDYINEALDVTHTIAQSYRLMVGQKVKPKDAEKAFKILPDSYGELYRTAFWDRPKNEKTWWNLYNDGTAILTHITRDSLVNLKREIQLANYCVGRFNV